MKEILIIGAGVIGCALARELAERGASVTVLEARTDVAEEASGAAIGTLSYSPSADMPDAWHLLASRSLAAHRDLSRILAKEVPKPPIWHWPGRLSVVTSNKAEKYTRQRLNEDLALGKEGEWLDKQAIHQQEPALGGRVQGGSFRAEQGWVDAKQFTRALAQAAQLYGATFHFNQNVQHFVWQGKQIKGVQTDTYLWQADLIIIAAGAWSGQIDPRLASPIEPVRGLALHFDLSESNMPQPLIRHLISGLSIYMIPDAQGITVGATHERVRFQPGITASGVSKLLSNALTLLPTLANANWAHTRLWYGFRPATPDQIPILGPDPRYPSLWWATGHFRSGILQAPQSALWLANAILGTSKLDARFSIARFL